MPLLFFGFSWLDLDVSARSKLSTSKGEWYETHQPTTDVAWNIFVPARVDYRSARTTLHEYEHGSRGASGGPDNGTFLVALGAIWSEVRLPPLAKAMAYWGMLYATYANWLITTLAAVFGTAALTPVASAGHHGEPWQESLVGAGFLSVAIVIMASVVLILLGSSGQKRAA